MSFHEHRLQAQDIVHRQSPNCSSDFTPQYIVLHYTVVMGFQECVEWFCDPEKQVSAHFVIGRSGEIAQIVACDQKAWHCGASHWGELSGLNSHAIGIEMVNAGKLEIRDGKIESWFGTPIPEEEIIWAQHDNEDAPAPWHKFTEAQIRSAQDLCTKIMQSYPIKDILGHDQIAPGRKIDPGPAFDLEHFKEFLDL